MKILRGIALLGTAIGVARRAVRYLRERKRTRREAALFGDVRLPPVAESPRFPVTE